MTTQSKSVLMPFLILAGILFAVALAWKYLGNHDAEPKVKPTQVEITTPVKTQKPATATTVPVTVDYDQPETVYLDPIVDEDPEVKREQAKSNMKFAMRYSTLDKAISGLRALRENGNDQAASELINYINISFPNDTIPSDLLD